MPFAIARLRTHLMSDISVDMVIRLHQGDPGADDGTRNLVPAGIIGTVTIKPAEWTVHGVQAQAMNTNDLDFGMVGAAGALGVSHFSMMRSGALYLTGALLRRRNFDPGGQAVILAGEIVVLYRPLVGVSLG